MVIFDMEKEKNSKNEKMVSLLKEIREGFIEIKEKLEKQLVDKKS